jgi:hypothetical protein
MAARAPPSRLVTRSSSIPHLGVGMGRRRCRIGVTSRAGWGSSRGLAGSQA